MGLFGIACGLLGIVRADCGTTAVLAWGSGIVGVLLVLTGYEDGDEKCKQEPQKIFLHGGEIVPQKHSTHTYYWGTVIAWRDDMANKPKPKKVGRPKLAKGDAKAVMLRVRISPAESKSIEAKAKASKQTVSEWIRSTLFPVVTE